LPNCQYKYESEYSRKRFECDEPTIKNSKFCIFHDQDHYEEYEDNATERFKEKLFESIHKKKSLVCIGYYLPRINFLELLGVEGLAQHAYFNKATFYRAANFALVTFLKNVDFTNATFIEAADFSGVRFNGITEFNKATFSKNVDFTNATFIEAAIFTNTTFLETANFAFSSFSKEVEFGEAKFLQNADFSKASFTEADFEPSTFTGKANFNFATFSETADFSKVTFNEAVDFNKAFFSDATFIDTKFLETVAFYQTSFSERLFFSDVTFSQIANFTSTKFQGEADFLHNEFKFEGHFHRTVFEHPTRVTFDNCSLSNVSFAESDITRIRFGDKVTWRGGKKDFRIMEEESLRKAANNKESIGNKFVTLELVLSIYRNLRENYEFRLRYDDAGRFFINEMELKRKYREVPSISDFKLRLINAYKKLKRDQSPPPEVVYHLEKTGPIRRNFSLTGLYYHFSRYGESIARPTIVWIIVVLLSTLFWVMQSNPSLEPHFDPSLEAADNSTFIGIREIDNAGHWLKGFERSLGGFLLFLSVGGETQVGIIDYIIKIFGGVLTFVLLAVALRRKFERKYTR
jgi:uncharacterized protein YjbI with pentapeptide repeats